MSPQQSALALSSTALASLFQVLEDLEAQHGQFLHMFFQLFDVAMDQYLLIPFLVG